MFTFTLSSHEISLVGKYFPHRHKEPDIDKSAHLDFIETL